MLKSKAMWSFVMLVAMQCIGQGVVWTEVWDSGLGDARIMAALWWAWTAVQILLAVAVGIALSRVGLRWARRWGAMDGIETARDTSNSQKRATTERHPGSAMFAV